jgi:hypothetical protein
MINNESSSKKIETDTVSTNPWDYVAVNKDQSTFDQFDIAIVGQTATSGSIFYNGRNQFPVQITLRCELDNDLLYQWQQNDPGGSGSEIIPAGAPVMYDEGANTYWVNLDSVASEYSVVYVSNYQDETNAPLSTDNTAEWFVSQTESEYATVYLPGNVSEYIRKTKENFTPDNQSEDGYTTVYLYVSAIETSTATPSSLDICLTVIVTPTEEESIIYSAGEYTPEALAPNHDKLLITAYTPKTYDLNNTVLSASIDTADFNASIGGAVNGNTGHYPCPWPVARGPWPVDQDNYYFSITDSGFFIRSLDTTGCTNVDSSEVTHESASNGSLYSQITDEGIAVFSITAHESLANLQIIFPLGVSTSSITSTLYNYSNYYRDSEENWHAERTDIQYGTIPLESFQITVENNGYPNSVCITRLNYNADNPPGWCYAGDYGSPPSGWNVNCSPNLAGDYDYGGWFGNFIIYDQYGNSGGFYIVNPNKNGAGGNGNAISINSGTDTD